jgi:hypothetical protein
LMLSACNPAAIAIEVNRNPTAKPNILLLPNP